MRILVTGAGGFVGQAVCRRLLAEGHQVLGALRQPRRLPEGVEPLSLGPLEEADHDGLVALLSGCQTVVHLAGRAHVMKDDAADPAEAFRRTNVLGSERLTRALRKAGVERFLFMSSVKALGESSPPGRSLTEADTPRPEDEYGRSKLEAERAITAMLAESPVKLAILRPPLVYGPGVRGNFLSLLRLVAKGLPLPFGAVTENRRSLIAVDNLADAVAHLLLTVPEVEGTFLLRDGEDLSTAELIRRLGEALGKPARLLPVPPGLLGFGARAAGRGAMAERLLGSLQLDDTRLRATGWRPPLDSRTAFEETARWFQEHLASAPAGR